MLRKITFGMILVTIGSVASPAGAAPVPQVQKITVVLSSTCKDGVMDEGKNEDACGVTITVTPKAPNRSFTLQQVPPGSKKWEDADKAKSSAGNAKFSISGYEEDEESGDSAFRDGKYSFRVVATKTSKEKAFTSSTFRINFIPDDTFGNDASDSDTSPATPTTAPKSGSSTVTTVNGGTPTNTGLPGGEDANWFPGSNPTSMGAFCHSGDPTMYVGATICGQITNRMTKTQFTSLISSISNSGPMYKRNGFCTQAISSASPALSVAARDAKCVEANAGR